LPTLSSTSRPVDTSALQVMLKSAEDLPTIPETLIHILNVIDDPGSGPADLAAAVRLDAPLMAKILKLANSPYYSPRGDIGDINRCVTVLGYRTVRQVAICISVATVLVKAVAASTGELDYRELWRHSVVTGAIAKHLARMTAHADPEAIFTAGLLHDVGKFILELQEPAAYSQVVRQRAQQKRPLVEVEWETFGYDHATLGEAFAREWRFPEILVGIFGNHHSDPAGSTGDDPHWRDTALVTLADYLANTIEPPRTDLGFDPMHVNVRGLHLAANVTVAAVEENLPAMREGVAKASSYLTLT
jgi:putative nucleotidyltransferase with HDIG domain